MINIVIAFVVGIMIGGIAVMSFYHTEFYEMVEDHNYMVDKYEEMKKELDECLGRARNIINFVDGNNT